LTYHQATVRSQTPSAGASVHLHFCGIVDRDQEVLERAEAEARGIGPSFYSCFGQKIPQLAQRFRAICLLREPRPFATVLMDCHSFVLSSSKCLLRRSANRIDDAESRPVPDSIPRVTAGRGRRRTASPRSSHRVVQVFHMLRTSCLFSSARNSS
jgi:hypothetical protein